MPCIGRAFVDWLLPTVVAGVLWLLLYLILPVFLSGAAAFNIRVLGFSALGVAIVVGVLRSAFELWKGKRRPEQ